MENKQPNELKTTIKRFSLAKEEREEVDNIQSVMDILSLLRKGMNHSLSLSIMRVRQRLEVDKNVPEGFNRIVEFDPGTQEIIITDTPTPPEPKKEEEKKEEVAEVPAETKPEEAAK